MSTTARSRASHGTAVGSIAIMGGEGSSRSIAVRLRTPSCAHGLCRLLLTAVVATLASIGSTAAAHTSARAARTITLIENGRLHLTSKHNFTLNEAGSASGTAAGAIYVHLTAVSSTRVTAEVNIFPRGGSLSCYGAGSYRRSGSTVEFLGSMSISRGTGRYSHIHGAGLRFSGSIAESDRDAITVRVSGRVSE
jgi:hypothetical protein